MKVTSIIVLALLLGSGRALAQDYYGPYYGEPRAATPGESHARGMADIARSKGQYNLATSEAAINMTEAQSRTIENRDQWTNTYFQMRSANRTYRAEQRAPRPSMEDLVRHAQAGRPSRLSPGELDSVSGRIAWPIVLQADRYAANRTELEKIYAKRANNGVIDTDDFSRIGELTQAMLAQLKEQIREVPAGDYLACKSFLESLAYEARVPAS